MAALGALGTSGAACDPAPRYGPQQSPYVGVTYVEGSVVATGDSQRLGMRTNGSAGENVVTLSLAAGAYPAGTRVTLRWVAELGLTGSDIDQLDQFGPRQDDSNGDVAVQLLPATPAPASPLTLELSVFDVASYDILHANPCDAAWQITGTAQAVAQGVDRPSVSFPIASPGLWALGRQPDGGQPQPVQRPDAGCRGPADGAGP